MPLPVPRLYALADVGVLGLEATPEAVAKMARVGIRWIQIRAKGVAGGALFRLVEGVLEAVKDTPSRIWLDDRVDVAALVPVSGVHLGQRDLPPQQARRVLGDDPWIGFSTHDADQVAAAEADEAVDVVALGPIFETQSKERPDPVVGLDGLRRARQLTKKPLVAIGGIHRGNLSDVLAAGADSVAILGAVCRGDVVRNCEGLLAQVKEDS